LNQKLLKPKAMKTTLILSALIVASLFCGCEKEEEMKTSSVFKVTIENVMEEKTFQSSGVFNTPVGATEAGGAGPGPARGFGGIRRHPR
jgi:hypothetical protein